MLGKRRKKFLAPTLSCLIAFSFVMTGTPNLIQAGSIFDDDFQPPAVAQPEPLRTAPAAPAQPDAATPAPPSPPPVPDPAAPEPAPAPPKAVAAPMRREIPSKEDRAKSRSLLKEVYSKELVDRSPSARKALADKFLQDAGNSTNAPSDEFVLLSGAIEAAQEASDLPRSFQAADAMAKDFPVDATTLKAQTLLKMSPRQFTSDRVENQRVGLALMDDLDKAGDYAQAERVGAMLQQNSGSGPDHKAIQQRVKTVHDKHVALNRVGPSLLVLKTSPDDPAANLEAGRYFCLVKGDWTRGLPMLAKGSDVPMKAMALKDLAATRAAGGGEPKSHDAEVVADAWWDAVDREATPAWKTAMQERAVFWYRQAVGGARGIAKLKIEKRIQLLPVTGFHAINTANAPEADAIVAEVAAHYPNAVKSAGELELVRVHDGMELHGGTQNTSSGSYAKLSKLVSGGGIGLANIYESWPAGRYLIVYRVRAFWPPTATLTGNDVCFLDVCHDSGTTLVGAHPAAEEFRRNEWSSIPIPLDLPKDDTIEYRLWPNNNFIAVDRIYIFRVQQ